MIWEKLGHVWSPNGSLPWAQQYAFPPVPHVRRDGTLRVYLASCDEAMVGSIGWVEVDPADPTRVLATANEPVLTRGVPGAFDENGVVPTCVLKRGGRLYLYYVGFQLGAQLRYFQFLGLAVSDDDGDSWQRVQRTPVIDRSSSELVNRTSGFALEVDGRVRLYYVGGSEWVDVDGTLMPSYDLRMLESDDPARWASEGRVVLPLEGDEYALGRPWVRPLEQGGYELFFSTRARNRSRDYRIGYAVSADGVTWERRMDEVGLDVSERGWDSEMVAYASLYEHGDATFLLYNGNDCGRTGFGAARLVSR